MPQHNQTATESNNKLTAKIKSQTTVKCRKVLGRTGDELRCPGQQSRLSKQRFFCLLKLIIINFLTES